MDIAFDRPRGGLKLKRVDSLMKSCLITPVVLAGMFFFGFGLPSVGRAEDAFSWIPENPEIGQEIEFILADGTAPPLSWDFGGENCEGIEGIFDCGWVPSYCQHPTWVYSSAGEKTVRLVTTSGETEMTLIVADIGGCCPEDGPPRAAFSISPNPARTGREVSFFDLSSGATTKDETEISFSWDPETPRIGEIIALNIEGVTSVEQVEWDFGEEGCDGYEQIETCSPDWTDCLGWIFVYATPGEKTISLRIDDSEETIEKSLTVLDEGSCEDESCHFSLSPGSASFPSEGGSGTFRVNTVEGCRWSARSLASWIQILSGSSGSGNGDVGFGVLPNNGSARTGIIIVEGKHFSIEQEAVEEPPPGDTSPDQWLWTVSLDDSVIVTSTEQNFQHVFDREGTYEVVLEVSNCRGGSERHGLLIIRDEAEGYLVPSAVHAPGQNQTQWRSDLWVFNPSADEISCTIRFLPENTDNSGEETPSRNLVIPGGGTAQLEDVLLSIPGAIGDSSTALGSLLITNGDVKQLGMELFIASRTFNQTASGTFGQFVPAIRIPAVSSGDIYFSGLAENQDFRTNLRLANFGQTLLIPRILLLDEEGNILGEVDPRPEIPALSTLQLNRVAVKAGVSQDLDLFSVRIEADGMKLAAWTSVVDNHTGDPVLYSRLEDSREERTSWLPGLAHLPGVNDSRWRSDLALFNAGEGTGDVTITYYPSENIDTPQPLEIEGVSPFKALSYTDVLAEAFLPGGENSKGYLLIEVSDGDASIQAIARTYNVAPEGGSFGQNLHLFDVSKGIHQGEEGIIPGIIVSQDSATGFRSNLGLLNLSREEGCRLKITLLDEAGNIAGEKADFRLEPGQSFQAGVAQLMGLGDTAVVGTIVIENLEGPAIAGFASVVDNQTQDPVLIPVLLGSVAREILP